MVAQQEIFKIAFPLRQVWCHRRFLLLICLAGAILELHVRSHLEARALLFLAIRSLADTAV